MSSFLDKEEFRALEKEYPFLSRARSAAADLPDTFSDQEFTIVDIETTGLDPISNEIIEFGAIKFKGPVGLDIFNTLVAPRSPISPHIERINGISNAMVAGYPGIQPALKSFLQFIGKDILIAHHVDFDLPFIRQHLKRELNLPLTNQNICTLKLARFLLPNLINHKLTTLAHYFKIETPNSHRAIGDCETTFQVWQKFQKLLKNQDLGSLPALRKLGLVC